MTTPTNEEFARTKRTFLQTAQVQMDRWREAFNQLVTETHQLSAQAQAEYRKDIADLRIYWQRVETAFTDLESAHDTHWAAAKADWQKKAEEFRLAFMHAAERIQENGDLDLGWLQGFTETLTAESEGWVEGLGKQIEDTEGWTEGMGRQAEKSEGWTEGYEEARK